MDWSPGSAGIGTQEVNQEITLIEQDDLSEEVRTFCVQHQLFQCLSKATSLVKACFVSIQSIVPLLEEDQDTGENWIVLEVTVQGDVDDVLEQYDKYTESWVTSVQWPECERVRLSYIIV